MIICNNFVFACIAVKSKFDVEEYSFSQTTLEQVFIEFAKQQEAEDEQTEVEEKERLNRLLGRQVSKLSSDGTSSSPMPITEL